MAQDDATFRDTPDNGPLSLIEAYWRDLAQETGLPARAAVDPQGLQGGLGHAFILERVGRGIARFRVAGQTICALMGMDVRGMPLSALAVTDLRDDLASRLEEVFEGPTVLWLEYGTSTGLMRATGRAELLLMPLLDSDGCVTRCLGGLVTTGGGSGPRKLVAPDAVRRRERVVPIGLSLSKVPERIGFAEGAIAFRADGRPKLRLVKG